MTFPILISQNIHIDLAPLADDTDYRHVAINPETNEVYPAHLAVETAPDHLTQFYVPALLPTGTIVAQIAKPPHDLVEGCATISMAAVGQYVVHMHTNRCAIPIADILDSFVRSLSTQTDLFKWLSFQSDTVPASLTAKVDDLSTQFYKVVADDADDDTVDLTIEYCNQIESTSLQLGIPRSALAVRCAGLIRNKALFAVLVFEDMQARYENVIICDDDRTLFQQRLATYMRNLQAQTDAPIVAKLAGESRASKRDALSRGAADSIVDSIMHSAAAMIVVPEDDENYADLVAGFKSLVAPVTSGVLALASLYSDPENRAKLAQHLSPHLLTGIDAIVDKMTAELANDKAGHTVH